MSQILNYKDDSDNKKIIIQFLKSMKYTRKDLFNLVHWEKKYILDRAKELNIKGVAEFLETNRRLSKERIKR